MRPIRTALALSLALGLAAGPVLSQTETGIPPVVETDTFKVFNGKWMQNKADGQNGLLMYLTQERAAKGDYFSIRCDTGGRSVRLGFGEKLPGVEGKDGRGKSYKALARFTVDDFSGVYMLEYTGATEDANIAKGNVHGYKMLFDSPEERDQFLDALRKGSSLVIEHQAAPIDLTGSGTAIDEQAAYCQ